MKRQTTNGKPRPAHVTGRGGVLSTMQIARYTGVCMHTVTKWIDSGLLKGFRVPGSPRRRVLPADFVRFLHAHGLPVPRELTPTPALAFALATSPAEEAALAAAFPGVVVAADPFHFGSVLEAVAGVGLALLGDAEGLGLARQAMASVLSRNPGAAVALVVGEDIAPPVVPAGVRVFRRPVAMPELRAELLPPADYERCGRSFE